MQAERPPTGEEIQILSNNNYKVLKIRDKSSKASIKCLKSVLIKSNKKQFIYHIENQFAHISDYIIRRFEKDFSSNFAESQKKKIIVTKNHAPQEHIQFVITTKYEELSNLHDFYITDRHKMLSHQLQISKQTEKSFQIYFILELFELVIRAGGLDNFFYTPKNIFFLTPTIKKTQQQSSYQCQYGKLGLNYTSLTAIKMFFTREDMSKDDFQQIYPCLPHDYSKYITSQYIIKDKKSLDRLNVIIKMKGFGWLLFTFVIKNIPNLLFLETNQPISRPQMMQMIAESPQIFRDLLDIDQYRKKIKEVSKITKIDLRDLLTQIFINNCQNLTWQKIYMILFPSHNFVNTEQHHQKVLKNMWLREKNKSFYEDKKLSSETKHVYGLAKMNINFHKFLQPENITMLLVNSQFSADNLKVDQILINVISQYLPQTVINYTKQQIDVSTKNTCTCKDQIYGNKKCIIYNHQAETCDLQSQTYKNVIYHMFFDVACSELKAEQIKEIPQIGTSFTTYRNQQVLHHLLFRQSDMITEKGRCSQLLGMQLNLW